MEFRNKSDKSALRDFFLLGIFSIFALAIFSLSVSANVFINEIMPSPQNVDWDLDRSASSGDEWIELYNNGTETVNLTGWLLNDSSGKTFIIPSNATPILAANDFFVVYKNKKGNTYSTQIELNNNGDTLSLYDNNSVLIDSISYASNPGNDIAFGRVTDGANALTNLIYPTPDTPNGDCTVPKDDLYLVRNTTLCNGSYHVSDANSDGFLVVFSDNITLDFNGSILIGTDYEDIAQVWQGIAVLLKDNPDLFKIDSRNVVIINAKIMNFGTAIEATNTASIEVKSSMFENNTLALELQNSNNTFVKNSYFKNSFKGINGFGLKDLSVVNSVFDENENGVVLNYSSDALILDTKFMASFDDDIFLKHRTNLDILNASFSTLNFVEGSDANATVKHYVVAKVRDNNNGVSGASVSATDAFGDLAMSDTTDGFGKTSDGTVLTDYIENLTHILSFNNYTFVISSADPKHLLLQESRAVNYSGEYSFTLAFEQVKPSIQMLSPSNNAIVKGILDFNVSASDNAALQNVSFYVDNALKQANTSLESLPQPSGIFTFRWNSSEVPDGNHTLKAVVFDSAGNSNSTEINVQVNNINLAPSFILIVDALQIIAEDSKLSFLLGASDTDPGETLTFSKNITFGSLNSVDATTTNFTFTPDNSNVGLNNLRFTVTDSGNLTGTFDVAINVTNTNDAPNINSTAVTTATEDVLYSYDADASDDDLIHGDVLAFSLALAPTGMAINSSTGLISWTPTNSQAGSNNVTVRVNDSSNAMAEQQFTINVTAVNDAPAFAQNLQNLAVNEDSLLYYGINCTDEETTSLTYYENASEFAINPVSGNFTWTPANENVGLHNVKFTCSDGEKNASQAITITVANTNDAPSINSTAVTTATEDSAYSYDADASDDDLGDSSSLVFSLVTKPIGMDINSSTGLIAWTPTNAQVGNNAVNVRVNDSSNATSEQQFTITVANTNDAPAITTTAITTATEDSAYSYDADASDDDLIHGDVLAFSLALAPTGMAINSSTGLISWTPTYLQTGNNNVTVRVNDSSNAMAEQQFTINVTAVNDAPVFAQNLQNLAVNEDAALYYDVNCTDEETTNLTYYENATEFAINPLSGNFTWTPSNDDVGMHNVKFTCSDGEKNASQAITITVANTNDAPSINTIGTNNTLEAVEDSLLVFSVTVKDDDAANNVVSNQENIQYFVNDTRFTITKINNSLANVTFLPNNSNVGKFAVKFSVNDSSNVSSSLNVAVNVTNSNDPPSLSIVGTNNVVQAVEDSLAAFTLAADDDDLLHGSSVGESLTYTANDSRFTVVKVNNTFANVTFLPVNSDVPTTSVKFMVTDKNNASSTQSTQTVLINVTNTNDAPVITAFYPIFDNPKISELGMQMFNVTPLDVDLNDNLAYTWEAKDGNNNSFNSLLNVDASDNKKANFTANGTIGNFVVKVTVKDSSNATALRQWTLTVADKPVTSTFDSSLTTNFSAAANLSDVANVTLGKSFPSLGGQPAQVLGLVSFKQSLDLSDVVDLDNLVNISKGFVRIDSKQLPQLNKSAKLIMQALDFKSAPIIKVDLEDGNGFVNCPAALCTNVSYDVNLTKDGSGALSFEVAHFTSYLASPNTTNVAPVIVSTPILTGKERSLYQYQIIAVDPNNDTLTYSLASSNATNSTALSVIPQGMSINNATGSISWLPAFGQNGTYSITLKVSDGNLSADQSYNLTIAASSRLSITEIKLKINDEDGDKKDTLVDGATSRDIKPGQNVEVTVKIENLFTKDDFEINDVDVEGVIKDIDDDDDMDDEDEDIDLDAGDEEKAKLNFEIPVYADKGEYKLIVTASGRGTDGIDYHDNATVFLVVEKKKHELAITKALLSPPRLNCVYDTVLQAVVNNLGKDQEDDGALVIENSLLNLSIREKLDLEEGTGDSDDENIFSKFYPLKLSKDVEAGTYDVRLSTYYDKTHLSKEKNVQLVVEECLEKKEAEKKQAVMEKPSEAEEQVVVVEKSADEIKALVPEFAAFDTTSAAEEEADTSFQTTLIIIALILLTGMGVLLIGAFVIKHK